MARFVLKRLGLGIVLLWLVVTVVFLALQRYFINGMLEGAAKE